jgi:acyl carrier protein
MAIDRAKAAEIVYSSIGELNRELSKSQQLEKSPSTVLSGEGGGLDSIAIVSFQMILEEKIAEALGADVFLDFEQFVDSAGTETRTVESLIDHLLAIVDQDSSAP